MSRTFIDHMQDECYRTGDFRNMESLVKLTNLYWKEDDLYIHIYACNDRQAHDFLREALHYKLDPKLTKSLSYKSIRVHIDPPNVTS